MKKGVIYISVILLISVVVISACEQYVGRNVNKANLKNINNQEKQEIVSKEYVSIKQGEEQQVNQIYFNGG